MKPNGVFVRLMDLSSSMRWCRCSINRWVGECCVETR